MAKAWLGIFIGEPSFWNKGIGSSSIILIVKETFFKIGINEIWLTVRETNYRAIRCYEKVGFKKVQKCGPKEFGMVQINVGMK